MVFPFGAEAKADMEADVMGASGDVAVDAAESGQAFADAAETLPDKTLKASGMMLDQIMASAAKAERMVLILASNKPEPPTVLKQLALATELAVDVVFM